MAIKVRREALPSGCVVDIFMLGSDDGPQLELSALGASVTRLRVADRHGQFGDVVLGLDHAADYWLSRSYFGASVGRYANRIAQGRLELDGVVRQLDRNDGANTLHGGAAGFHRKFWRVEADEALGVFMHCISEAGEMGFPGRLQVGAHYKLLPGGGFSVAYEARSDAATAVSIANHAYFNLDGEGAGAIDAHEAHILADRYLPVRQDLVPTGEIVAVRGGAFDFTKLRRIGEGLAEDDDQLKRAGGYDHCYLLREQDAGLHVAAQVRSLASGRVLRVKTSAPALQFYTGNMLDGSERRGGAAHWRRSGFCMEAQAPPNAPNEPGFGFNPLLPGEVYRAFTEYEFWVET